MNDRKKFITHWIKPKMAPLGEFKTVDRQVGVRIEKKRKGFFNSEFIDVEVPVYEQHQEFVPDGTFSETEIDYADLTDRMEALLNKIDLEGYDVISIMPVTHGHYDWGKFCSGVNSAATCYSYGYGYTGGVVITAQRKVICPPKKLV